MKASFLNQFSGQVHIGSHGEYSLRIWFIPLGSKSPLCVVDSNKGILHALLLLKLSLFKQYHLMKYADKKYPYAVLPQTAEQLDKLFKEGAFAILYPMTKESIHARIITLRIPSIDSSMPPPYAQQGQGHTMLAALQHAMHATRLPIEIMDASVFT